MEKPSGKPAEASWLEPHDAALLLESARTYRLGPNNALAGPIYPLLATMLLTGGRTSEVLGLEVDDVSFQRQTITFRPNAWRRLKTLTSHRSVRLWPQLEAILRLYFADRERGGGLGRPYSSLPPHRPQTRLSRTSVRHSARWRCGPVGTRARSDPRCSGTPTVPPGSRLLTAERPCRPSPWARNSDTAEHRWCSGSTATWDRFAIALTWWSTVSRTTERHLGKGSQRWRS